MVKKHTIDTTDELWADFLQLKIRRGFKNNDLALETLIKEEVAREKDQCPFYLQDTTISLPPTTKAQINKFVSEIRIVERALGKPLLVLHDKKSDAFYVECHIFAKELLSKMDTDAVIDPDYQEEFRANRQLQPNNIFFKKMLTDASEGRQFSDIVIEYADYPPSNKPLKVLGGQHRGKAIEESGQNRVHGIRVYFDLTKDKRVELYIASNSNIQVPSDLLDRLDETSLEPPNKLRDWCYAVEIMKAGQDFNERRSAEEEVAPTVRMMRTFIINFYEGKKYRGSIDEDAHTPVLAETAGEEDSRYIKFFKEEDFSKDETLMEAGKAFVKLHKKQFGTIQKMNIHSKKEFRIKAYNLALIAAWAFAVGVLQKDKKRLEKLYKLPDLASENDSLNAEAMQKARHSLIDQNTSYRGLGTRTDENDRGRLLQLFIEYSNSEKPRVTLDMCNAAIEIYHSNKARYDADLKRKKAF